MRCRRKKSVRNCSIGLNVLETFHTKPLLHRKNTLKIKTQRVNAVQFVTNTASVEHSAKEHEKLIIIQM